MRKITFASSIAAIACIFCQCNQPPVKNEIETKPVVVKSISYQLENSKDWIKKNGTDSLQNIVLDLNRTDKDHIAQIDSIIVPNDVAADRENYFPFPSSVPELKDIRKLLFFSYPTQSFAAYELGQLVYTGPVNMGRKKDPTPTGLYFTNWKAEKTTSTFNDEWDLRWNFNIDNKAGIGFHQYGLPGYPASHSCLRLQEKDARYLYNWAQEWMVGEKDSVKAQGTPVIVFGNYSFDGPKPWMHLVANPHVLDISANEIRQVAAPFLLNILAQQMRRDSVDLK